MKRPSLSAAHLLTCHTAAEMNTKRGIWLFFSRNETAWRWPVKFQWHSILHPHPLSHSSIHWQTFCLFKADCFLFLCFFRCSRGAVTFTPPPKKYPTLFITWQHRRRQLVLPWCLFSFFFFFQEIPLKSSGTMNWSHEMAPVAKLSAPPWIYVQKVL